MKQKLNQILPVEFGIDLSTVSKIDFIFNQSNRTKWSCSYPSEEAFLSTESENTVSVVFSPETTSYFHPETPIMMDTKITLKSSEYNPQTEIVTFVMDKTLF